jgi:hypothetical protein
MFSAKKADIQPGHAPHDHPIELEPDLHQGSIGKRMDPPISKPGQCSNPLCAKEEQHPLTVC